MKTNLNILKVSVIDWCYRLGRRTRWEWMDLEIVLSNIIEKHTDIDYIFLERVSKCWYSDFIKYVDIKGYTHTFVETANVDKRIMKKGGGSCILIKEGNNTKFRKFTLPSSRPQPDGGQPSKIVSFNWNDINVLIGCMPQNLGRDGLKEVDYWYASIEKFWGDGCNTDCVVVPIYDEELKEYDYHHWQTSQTDAILDDKYIANLSKQNKSILLIEEFGVFHGEDEYYDVDMDHLRTHYPITKKKVNTLNVYSTEDINVFDEEVENIPRVTDTSFVKLIKLEYK